MLADIFAVRRAGGGGSRNPSLSWQTSLLLGVGGVALWVSNAREKKIIAHVMCGVPKPKP